MKLKILVFFTAIAAMLSACGGMGADADTDAEERRDLPVVIAEAKVQRDHATLVDLIIEPNELLNKERESENDYEVTNYELIEWKYDEDVYFYEITYFNERLEKTVSDKLEVKRTEEGWKSISYSDSDRFDDLVPTLGEGEVIREMGSE